jgi:hypothetical protein
LTDDDDGGQRRADNVKPPEEIHLFVPPAWLKRSQRIESVNVEPATESLIRNKSRRARM